MNTIIKHDPFYEFQITEKENDLYEIKVLKKPLSLAKGLDYTMPIIIEPSIDGHRNKRNPCTYMKRLRDQLRL